MGEHLFLKLARLPVPPLGHCVLNDLPLMTLPRWSKTERVTCPEICRAVFSETPALIILRIAERRKSCRRIGTFAAAHILSQATRKSRTGLPSSQVNTDCSSFLSLTQGFNRSYTSVVILTFGPCRSKSHDDPSSTRKADLSSRHIVEARIRNWDSERFRR